MVRIPEGVFATSLRVRVGYIDTDRGQVMHHSTYLRYLEHARVEHMRERGLDYRSFEDDLQLALPVVEATVRYKLPARFDDELEIKTWVGAVNRAKLRFDSVVLRGAELLTSAEITLCCISGPEQRLRSMPDVLLALGKPR
jgi:acyl-CoA thioester hydrolase